MSVILCRYCKTQLTKVTPKRTCDQCRAALKFKHSREFSDTPITDQQLGLDAHQDSHMLRDFIVRHNPGRALRMQTREYLSNKIGNHITETSFFKKYPILTFCLLVGSFLAVAYCNRH